MKRLPFRYATANGEPIDTLYPSDSRFDLFMKTGKKWYLCTIIWCKEDAIKELEKRKKEDPKEQFVLLELKQTYTQIP